MSYRKDQGRYARMAAFWALLSLMAYGCFHGGGLSDLVDGWLGASNQVFVDPFPILKTLKTSTLIALGVLAAIALIIHGILNSPKIADTLIDTEAELMKVTWPSWGEAWAGTVAVTVMVVLLFVFLTLADLGLTKVMLMLMGGA
ncbi:MAG: preprotein translocase subunit SecE [Planctomycetes bacterium]|nr:preprotein translocase subunit SecE [Planctomycetota bacterium]